jgi:hypothetical protein
MQSAESKKICNNAERVKYKWFFDKSRGITYYLNFEKRENRKVFELQKKQRVLPQVARVRF